MCVPYAFQPRTSFLQISANTSQTQGNPPEVAENTREVQAKQLQVELVAKFNPRNTKEYKFSLLEIVEGLIL